MGELYRPPSVEETRQMKPTDKAILGMVSDSPGHNGSEPTSGLKTFELATVAENLQGLRPPASLDPAARHRALRDAARRRTRSRRGAGTRDFRGRTTRSQICATLKVSQNGENLTTLGFPEF